MNVRHDQVETTQPAVVTNSEPTVGAPTERVAPVTSTRSTTVRRPGFALASVVWLIVGVLDVVLAFDFLFRALKANDTGFADLIYSIGGALAAPFDGIFGATVTNTSYVVRWGDLLAIAIYTLVGMAIVSLIRIATGSRDDVTTVGTTL